MKKFLLSLVMLFSLTGITTAVAQEAFSSDPNTIYFITNLRSAKYVQAQTGKRITQSAQINEDCAFLFVTAGDPSNGFTPVKLKSPKTNKFLQDVNNGSWVDEESAAQVWQIHAQTQGGRSGYSISKSTNLTSNSDSWNDFGGTGTQLGYWNANDPGSVFAIESWEQLVDSHTGKNYIGDGPLNISATKREAFKAQLQLGGNPTIEDIKVKLPQLTTFKYTDYMNLGNDPVDCVLKNEKFTTDVLSAVESHRAKGLSTLATRGIWTIQKTGDKISLKNKATQEYIALSNDRQVILQAQEATLSIYPYNNNYVVIGNDAQYQKLHEGNNKDIVGWEYISQASHWKVETLTPEAIAQAATEESRLTNAVIDEVRPLCTVLGVSPDFSGIQTLGDYMDTNPRQLVYQAAKDNVYRIVTDNEAGNDRMNRAFGINSQNQPAGMEHTDKATPTTSTDLSQLWRFVPSGNGFKIVNWNKQAANEPCAIGDVKETGGNAAVLKTIEQGGEYHINLSQQNGKQTARFFRTTDMSGSGSDAINMAPEPRGYILNRWAAEGARFVIQKIETIVVPMTTIADNAWATIYLPFGVRNQNADVTAYVASAPKGNYLPLSQTNDVKAANGAVLKAAASTEKATLNIDNTAETESRLSGSTVSKTLNDGDFIFSTGDQHTDVIGFYKAGTTHNTLGANKAYLPADQATAMVRSLALGFNNDGTTAIESIQAQEEKAEGTLYDLSGRRVKSNAKGVVISKGKKFILK